MINKYAQQKQHGFSYKEYPVLPCELWKGVEESENDKGGRWEISNLSRVKYITKYAENVLSGERLRLSNGYPTIMINGQNLLCHILAFKAFFPEEYMEKKSDEMILHKCDDRLDFRPQNLRIGTRSENTTDAYDNGKYDGTKRVRVICASYINGVLEKEHDSQSHAVRYLKSIGYDKASVGSIGKSLRGKYTSAYGRTWKLST